MDWWRSWHGAPTDPKWLGVARRAQVSPSLVIAAAWCLFDAASQAEERGSVEKFDIEGTSAFLGCSEEELDSIMNAMDAMGIIHDCCLTSWWKRQPEREDYSTERVRRYRDRTNTKKRIETHGNAPDTDTDTDTDKKKKEGANAPLVFDGMVIKLNEIDHSLWKQTFSNVELNAYLVSRDQFLASLPEDDSRRLKWMVSTSADLRNKNQASKSSRKPNGSNGRLSFRPEPPKITQEEWKKLREEANGP